MSRGRNRRVSSSRRAPELSALYNQNLSFSQFGEHLTTAMASHPYPDEAARTKAYNARMDNYRAMNQGVTITGPKFIMPVPGVDYSKPPW